MILRAQQNMPPTNGRKSPKKIRIPTSHSCCEFCCEFAVRFDEELSDAGWPGFCESFGVGNSSESKGFFGWKKTYCSEEIVLFLLDSFPIEKSYDRLRLF